MGEMEAYGETIATEHNLNKQTNKIYTNQNQYEISNR